MNHLLPAVSLCLVLAGRGCGQAKSPATSAQPTASAQPIISAPETDPDFPGWPASWVDAYKRFEGYILARQANWPISNLHFSSDGAIEYSLRTAETRTEHLTLDVYQRGREVLGMGLLGGEKDNLGAENRFSRFTPGSYAAYIKSAGSLGYQTHFPIVWIDVLESSAINAKRERGFVFKLRETTPPGRGDELWPNERLRLFLDFHIFPHHRPDEIHKANAKVQPAIDLRVNNAGVITREQLLEGAVEQLLRWRIYYNGELVEKGPATGVKRQETDHGVGSYTVCLGVDGPTGFMPVSNLVEYPLFPSGSAQKTIMLEMDKNDLPDFAKRTLARKLATNRAFGQDTDLAKPSLSAVEPGDSAAQAKDEELTALWSGWAFTLEHPNIFTIPFAK